MKCEILPDRIRLTAETNEDITCLRSRYQALDAGGLHGKCSFFSCGLNGEYTLLIGPPEGKGDD